MKTGEIFQIKFQHLLNSSADSAFVLTRAARRQTFFLPGQNKILHKNRVLIRAISITAHRGGSAPGLTQAGLLETFQYGRRAEKIFLYEEKPVFAMFCVHSLDFSSLTHIPFILRSIAL